MGRFSQAVKAYHKELRQLRDRGVPKRTAQTVLKLVFGTLVQFRRASLGLSAATDTVTASRLARVVERLWARFPDPELWEAMGHHRFETGGARMAFMVAIKDEIEAVMGALPEAAPTVASGAGESDEDQSDAGDGESWPLPPDLRDWYDALGNRFLLPPP